MLCLAWPRSISRELLLNPIVIHRSDHEYVMIETAVNSVRISIKVRAERRSRPLDLWR